MKLSFDSKTTAELDARSIYLRKVVVQMLEGGRRGHLGSALSIIEILRVLYDDILSYDPKKPLWYERDRSTPR